MKLNRILGIAVVGLTMTVAHRVFPNSHSMPDKTEMARTEVSPEAQKLLNRLEEIKGMDLKNMPKSERKALRKETRAIEKELKEMGGYIYISAAGLLIIILLFLLIL